MQKSKNAIIQIGSLFLIQWLSIAVIVLNASALNASKDSNQGLIMASETGPQDFIMLIMAATSLFCVSLLLCLYLQLFFRLMGNKPFSLSKSILYVEVAFSFIIISFWMAATVIVLKHFNASSSCRHPSNISTLSDKIAFDNNNRNILSSSACSLMNATIILAFITISIWLIPLCVSIYSLLSITDLNINIIQSSIHPYQDIKLQISRSSSANPHYHQQEGNQRDLVQDKMHYSTITKIGNEGDQSQNIFVITSPDMSVDKPSVVKKNKENDLSPIENPFPSQQKQQQQQQRSYISMQQPQEPDPVILTNKKRNDWDFDFDFEPVNIDLMLPSSNELINDHGRKQFYYN